VMNMSNDEGENGLDFVEASDPRLVVDSAVGSTCDGGTWYYPNKFGNPPTGLIPLATGVEARLVQAEAALNAGATASWASQLNALRANPAATGVTFPPASLSIAPDSTVNATARAQVDEMFRERAFWLYGTGSRLGDLRRLIRQYGRNASAVFPTGTYASGQNASLPAPIPSYGTDLHLTLPTAAGAAEGYSTQNPNYRGCTSSGA
jgi:starch-binding outer membrane protein, SusD/RagB family